MSLHLRVSFVVTASRAKITHLGGIDGEGLPWVAPIPKVITAMEAGLPYSVNLGLADERLYVRVAGGTKVIAVGNDLDSRRLLELPRLL